MIFGEVHETLHEKYSCTSLQNRCSNYEIALKQWAYSEVTLDPPGDWEPSYSVASMYPTLFAKPFEYGWFANEFKDVVGDVRKFSLEEVKYLLSYDCLFSATMGIKSFIYAENNDLDEFRAWFLFDEFNQLLHY